MPKYNDIDGGTPQAYKAFLTGLTVGEAIAEGAQVLPYPRGTVARKWSVKVTMLLTDAPSFGNTAAAGTRLANEYRMRQLEELAGNYYMQPVYIQWFAGGTVTSSTQPQDGWYLIESCKVDYTDTVFGIIYFDLNVVFLYPGGTPPLRRSALWWAGGALTTTYTGAMTPWLALPIGTQTLPGVNALRPGADGTNPFTTPYYRADMAVSAGPVNPFWFQWSGTIAKWFQGGCRVFDTINTAANPIGGGVSILTNSGFELNPGGWLINNVGTGTGGISVDFAHTGSTSFKETNPSNGNYGGAFQSTGIPVVEGQILAVSFWAKSNPGSGTSGPFRITFTNPGTLVSVNGIASGQPSAQAGTTSVDLNVALTGTWTQFFENVTVPAGYKWAFIELYANGNGAAANIYWDDIVILPALYNNNWVEVFGIDHVFQGDAVITNGLLQILFQLNSGAGGVGFYHWNSTAVTPQWTWAGNLMVRKSGGSDLIPTSLSFIRYGREDVFLTVMYQGAANTRVWFRLQRGQRFVRIDGQPLSENNSDANFLWINLPATPKILFNENIAKDNVLNEGAVNPTGTYGYGSALITNNSYPYIASWLYQNTPSSQQPQMNGTAGVGIGDSTVPLQGNIQSYAYAISPFATPANAQAEGESGAFDAGWSSVADGGASGGNTAKCASGTVIAHKNTFGTAWLPTYGTYNVWVHVKVTNAGGVAVEMRLGLWDATSNGYATVSDLKASDTSVSYVWKLVGQGSFTLTASRNYQFRCETLATLGTDWFIDEAVMVPVTNASGTTPTLDFPQDLFQQFLWATTSRIS